ncbi:MarR family transcriptional regulator [Lactobacillus sp. ESL0791]|uniref:MarR family winged helix-turn-helix transcriptional regulator n=1 Tax=Lactobacillus sp. ESL0791 TaxID=2983234 RepID=UPI0023F80385|nr:MarR family transcriptional regulator [Lactobacillus sp. ESL0791]MDF7639348.1 MarR family transcriptional regulator [Lactobacillus sp. ESL0791]
MQEFTREIGPQIKIANTLIEKELNQRILNLFSDYNLTGVQSMLLVSLYEAGKQPVIQKELADRFVLSHPTIRSIVRRLEKAGLVEVGHLESDRRQVTLALTSQAQKLMVARIDEIYDVMNDVNQQIIAGMSEKDAATLAKMLSVIISNFK